MPEVEKTSAALRFYEFYGMDLTVRDTEEEARGDCPFCGREEKFSVSLKEDKEGLARCLVCSEGTEKGGMNVYSFLRKLWEASEATTARGDMEELAQSKGLFGVDSIIHYKLRRSIITEEWLLPAYNQDKRMVQLYRYARVGYTNDPTDSTGSTNSTSSGGKKYRYAFIPSPELGHGLIGVDEIADKKEEMYVCEGVWDACILWESMRLAKFDKSNGNLLPTTLVSGSLYKDANILAVPGCGTFNDSWASVFSGKKTYLLYDSDHPKLRCKLCKKSYSKVEHSPHFTCPNPSCNGHKLSPKPVIAPAGYSGMKRVAHILSTSSTPPQEIYYLDWRARDEDSENANVPLEGEEEGYNSRLPSGTDIRDLLTLGESDVGVNPINLRVGRLEGLLSLLEKVPDDWLGEKGTLQLAQRGLKELTVLPCNTWQELEDTWKKALRWRQDLSDVLSVMLAVSLSTEQPGDQLYLQVEAPPGTGKTRLCEGMLVSKKCKRFEHVKGIHSGWKDKSGEDFSLLSRINLHCLITPEADVLTRGASFEEIMSQLRRAFDGSTSASYKNSNEDKLYSGLRIPWILAGTPESLHSDQSRLGDRFLRICINPPDEEEKRAIMRRVCQAALTSVMQIPNCKEETTLEPQLAKAYRMTGGYVDWCRNIGTTLLSKLKVDEEYVFNKCSDLADFTADMRARPDPSWMRSSKSYTPQHDKEIDPSKELPSRLVHQYVRLAVCLAVVLNKQEIDSEVMRRIAKVALDTSKGATLDIVNMLYRTEQKATTLATTNTHSSNGRIKVATFQGVQCKSIAYHTEKAENKVETLLLFLRKVGVVKSFAPKLSRNTNATGVPLYRLSERFTKLYESATQP